MKFYVYLNFFKIAFQICFAQIISSGQLAAEILKLVSRGEIPVKKSAVKKYLTPMLYALKSGPSGFAEGVSAHFKGLGKHTIDGPK